MTASSATATTGPKVITDDGRKEDHESQRNYLALPQHHSYVLTILPTVKTWRRCAS